MAAGRKTASEKEEKLKHKLEIIKTELESGKMKTFEQLFAVLEPTPFAAAIKMPYYTFSARSSHPMKFTLQNCKTIATLLGTDVNVVINFMLNQKQKKGPSKN